MSGGDRMNSGTVLFVRVGGMVYATAGCDVDHAMPGTRDLRSGIECQSELFQKLRLGSFVIVEVGVHWERRCAIRQRIFQAPSFP